MVAAISSGLKVFTYTRKRDVHAVMLVAGREMLAAEAAYRRGDLMLTRRLLASLLRADRNHLSGWRLMLRSLEQREHRQNAAQEILRLAPGDQEALQVLQVPNHAISRTGSRARVPAFGELSQDDDPFGELADFRARNGLPIPQFSDVNRQMVQAIPPTSANPSRFPRFSLPRIRLPRYSLRLPKLRRRQTFASNVGFGFPWRTLIIVLGMGLLLGGAYVTFQPLQAPFSANALPVPQEELAHPALAHIQYPTENLQALGLDEPRRNSLEGTSYDLYHFDGVRGLLLSVDVISLDPVLDPVVELYDPNGELLHWNDNGDFSLGYGTLNSRLEIVLPKDGRYLISVGGIVGDGKYIISMRNH